jgi:plasmid maintenance system antidote protein VapI
MNTSFVTLEQLRSEGLIGAPLGVGYHIDQFIRRLGLTKEEAAKRIGVSKSTITRVVNGDSQLSVELSAKLKQHLDAPVELFFRIDAEAKAYQVDQMLKTT